jgi:NifB/MoaA-like Fe-S oxidoreductase
LHVSIHATDPDVRSAMLKNPRGGMSLRWLRALLDHDIAAVKGQIVVCPRVNDGAILDNSPLTLDFKSRVHEKADSPL